MALSLDNLYVLDTLGDTLYGRFNVFSTVWCFLSVSDLGGKDMA